MNTIYCAECGAKSTYTFSKPKFCSGCGNSLNSLVVKPAKKVVRQLQEDDVEEDEDFSDSDEVPSLARIDVEVEKPQGHPTFTLGSLFNDNTPAIMAAHKRNQSVDDFITNKSPRGE